jgi:acyl-CoA-binding protein
LTIYNAFDTPFERAAYLSFRKNIVDKVRFNVKVDKVRFNVKDDIYNAEKTMIKLYKLGENDKQRKQLFKVIEKFPYDFIEFLKFFPDFDNADEYINFIKKLFSRSENSLLIFFLIKTNQIDSFELYMREHQRHASSHHGYSYLSRAYLRYMRGASALKTRQKNLCNWAIQSIYETRIGDQLPAAFPNDPYLPQARGIITTVNAHEHEALYQLDQPLLWKQTAAFNPVPSPTARTLYNNKLMVTENYHTNAEVEEFINYLDTTLSTGPAFALDGGRMSGDRAVSIIKQILGIEQKASNTSGGFAPYLGSSMYYAKSDSPKGDEMLGRTWHLMRNVSKSDQDLALNQRSVALALLNSVDVCGQLVSTHCQTRTTGQLMQLVCCYLEGSHLRPVIINDRDESAATSDAAVIDRIKAAPALARSLFDSFRREDQGEIRRLIERHNEAGVEPQLWERYKAYYDMLYRRTSKASGKGYYCDENILTMDELGNMVSKYGANGWSRAAPVIIYYQAEFLVLEKVFTDLMHAEFEKKRGGYNLTHLSQPRAPESRWVRIFSNTWR